MPAPAAGAKRHGNSGGKPACVGGRRTDMQEDRGGGQGDTKKATKGTEARGLPAKQRFWKSNERGNYREIFILTFRYNFWPRRPRGRANDRKEDFFVGFAS